MTEELVPQEREIILAPGVVLTKTGALIDENVSLEHWAAALRMTAAVANATMWALGDLLLHAHEHASWGEKYTQYLDLTGKSYSTLTKSTYLARKYPHEERLEGISWSHHMEAAAIPDRDERHALLKRAKDEGWTREQIHDHRTGEDVDITTPPTHCCPSCGYKF